MIVIESRGVSRTFASNGKEITALHPVSLKVMGGEFLIVIGPSGSGKSTLLNLLSGLDKPTEGEVLFQGEALSALNGRKLAWLRNGAFGFVFQTPHVIPHKTVAENVALPFQYGRPSPRTAMWHSLDSLLNYVGLAELAARYPNTLSGGELQRLVFARALIKDPFVIFADEPTGTLDAENSRHLLELLLDQAQRGKSIVMASHDPSALQYGTSRLDLDKFSDVSAD